jgi:hypothetical protein
MRAEKQVPGLGREKGRSTDIEARDNHWHIRLGHSDKTVTTDYRTRWKENMDTLGLREVAKQHKIINVYGPTVGSKGLGKVGCEAGTRIEGNRFTVTRNINEISNWTKQYERQE